MSLRVVNWNVQRATPRSERSPEILRRIAEHDPDVICLTETDLRLLSGFGGHIIEARTDPGKGVANHQRKVLLWSLRRWSDIDDFGSETLPPGRFVSGATETPAGQVMAIGVCIPWHNANVNVGAKKNLGKTTHHIWTHCHRF